MRPAAWLFGVGSWLALATASGRALAFEREWHLGGSAGVATGSGLRASPALGVYAAYGLSDVFDARVELTARGYELGRGDAPNAVASMVGVAYKLDVLRWVPWAGVYAGYLAFLQAPPKDFAFKRSDVALGLGAGLDYGFSRQLGLGVTLRFDQALGNSDASTFDALLRAEYRWGW